jgi:hypothetical protein
MDARIKSGHDADKGDGGTNFWPKSIDKGESLG